MPYGHEEQAVPSGFHGYSLVYAWSLCPTSDATGRENIIGGPSLAVARESSLWHVGLWEAHRLYIKYWEE